MLYALVDGVKRAPVSKGERTTCRDCGGLLTSVIPSKNVKHWRHKSGDCDRWSEPEGLWHLRWKEEFPDDCREIGLYDKDVGEWHRADVLCGAGTNAATVLELQHSSISEAERLSREAFYQRDHRMFWLVHLHDEQSFNGTNFRLSLGMGSRSTETSGRRFSIVHFASRSSHFIEKWKRSSAYVFFDFQDHLFFLAGPKLSIQLNGGQPLEKGQFAYSELSKGEFIRAVHKT